MVRSVGVSAAVGLRAVDAIAVCVRHRAPREVDRRRRRRRGQRVEHRGIDVGERSRRDQECAGDRDERMRKRVRMSETSRGGGRRGRARPWRGRRRDGGEGRGDGEQRRAGGERQRGQRDRKAATAARGRRLVRCARQRAGGRCADRIGDRAGEDVDGLGALGRRELGARARPRRAPARRRAAGADARASARRVCGPWPAAERAAPRRAAPRAARRSARRARPACTCASACRCASAWSSRRRGGGGWLRRASPRPARD